VPKRYHIDENHIAEIESACAENRNKNIRKRLQARLMHAQGKKHSEIAEKTGFAESYISELVSKYCNKGISAVTKNHYTGNRRNLSFAEEEALLEPFREKAKAGQIVNPDISWGFVASR